MTDVPHPSSFENGDAYGHAICHHLSNLADATASDKDAIRRSIYKDYFWTHKQVEMAGQPFKVNYMNNKALAEKVRALRQSLDDANKQIALLEKVRMKDERVMNGLLEAKTAELERVLKGKRTKDPDGQRQLHEMEQSLKKSNDDRDRFMKELESVQMAYTEENERAAQLENANHALRAQLQETRAGTQNSADATTIDNLNLVIQGMQTVIGQYERYVHGSPTPKTHGEDEAGGSGEQREYEIMREDHRSPPRRRRCLTKSPSRHRSRSRRSRTPDDRHRSGSRRSPKVDHERPERRHRSPTPTSDRHSRRDRNVEGVRHMSPHDRHRRRTHNENMEREKINAERRRYEEIREWRLPRR